MADEFSSGITCNANDDRIFLESTAALVALGVNYVCTYVDTRLIVMCTAIVAAEQRYKSRLLSFLLCRRRRIPSAELIISAAAVV